MAVYEYTAKDKTGSEFSGTYGDIGNVTMLRKELAMMDYVLVKAHRKRAKAGKHKKIKQSEVVAFAYKFAGMYSAGLSVLKCLETLEEQDENQTLREVTTDIREEIETGSSLENAFGKYKNIFSEFFVGMLRAGESGGKLATALEMSAEYLEKQADLKRRVKSAFVYPAVVCAMCILIIGCLLLFVVPIFSKLYDQLHVPLPGPTQVLVGFSFLIRNWWWAILIVVSTIVVVIKKLLSKPKVRAKWDAFKLDMPAFSRLNRMVVISHFTRTFAMLASVGISLIDALDTASQVAHNYKLTEIAKELQKAIKAGHPVAESLKNYDIFPPMIIQLAASGEQAGMLPEMLNKGADFLDKDIDRVINSLLVKIEPALTVVMGVIVGFLLISIYLPMFDYMIHLQ